MSEDLRYYFFDDEADEQPSIPPEEGWKQMQQLLDAELPLVSKRKPRRYLFLTVTAVTGFILLFTSLPLQDLFVKSTALLAGKKEDSLKVQDNIAAKQNENGAAKISANTTMLVTDRSVNNTLVNPARQSLQQLNNTVTDLYNYNTNGQKDGETSNESVITNEVAKLMPQPVITDTAANITAIKNNDKEASASANNKENKPIKDKHKSWQLYAGVATNISFNNTLQGLQPYPFATLQYQLTPRFFAGASLSLFSPVSSRANGIKKTVYINDTFANVSMYNEKLNYKRLYYTDLSLTAGIKLNKHVSVQGGVQFSRLLNSKTNTSLVPYDFDMNTVSILDTARLSPTPSAAPIYNNKVEAKKLDIRYVAGINYNFKKLSLGLQYQAGVKPVLKGDAVTADKNKLITVKAVYRLR